MPSIPAMCMGAWGDRQRLQKQRCAIVHERVERVLRFTHCRVTLIRRNGSSDTDPGGREETGFLVFWQTIRKACRKVVQWSLGVLSQSC
jgi:hypothetical protein